MCTYESFSEGKMWVSHPQNMIGEKKEKMATVYNPCDRKVEQGKQGGREGGDIINVLLFRSIS